MTTGFRSPACLRNTNTLYNNNTGVILVNLDASCAVNYALDGWTSWNNAPASFVASTFQTALLNASGQEFSVTRVASAYASGVGCVTSALRLTPSNLNIAPTVTNAIPVLNAAGNPIYISPTEYPTLTIEVLFRRNSKPSPYCWCASSSAPPLRSF